MGLTSYIQKLISSSSLFLVLLLFLLPLLFLLFTLLHFSRRFNMQYQWILYVGMAASFILIIPMACIRSLRL